MALPEVRVMSDADLTPEARLRRMLKVELEQEGADPTGLLLLLERAVKEEIWVPLGLSNFAALIEESYPTGLGWRIDDVKTMMQLRHKHEHHTAAIRDRMEWLRGQVRNLLNPTLREEAGRPANGDNVPITTKKGNDPGYALRRLKRDNPELATRVLVGEISAHAAAIEAGFRLKTITIPVHTERAARALVRAFQGPALDDLLREIDAQRKAYP